VAFRSSSRSPKAAEPSNLRKAQKPYANATLNLVNVYYIKYSSSLIMQTKRKKSVIRVQTITFRPGV
jgi:hypothetical protein